MPVLLAGVGLLEIAVAVLLAAFYVTHPVLATTQSAAPVALPSRGQVSFGNSGQLDPASSKGLNDTITVSLHGLAVPAAGQSDYAWLMPDPSDDTTRPLLLGKLSNFGRKG